MSKIDLRARISGILILLIFVIVPFVIWKYQINIKNLKKRGVYSEGTVVKIDGFMGRQITYEYVVNGQKFESWIKIKSNHYKIGDRVKIIYDSLDVENVEYVW